MPLRVAKSLRGKGAPETDDRVVERSEDIGCEIVARELFGPRSVLPGRSRREAS